MKTDLAAVGGALVLGGAVLSRSPGLGGALSSAITPTMLAALGALVALVGVVGIASKPEAQASTDHDTESGPGDLLGAEFDATLARIERMSSTELRRSQAPREVRSRLRAAAVATVVRRQGVDRQTAAHRVDSGEWTDDPVAAAFLGSARAPPSVRWREALSDTPRTVSRARRTAAVLEAMV